MIHDKYTANEMHGEFKALTLFMDMSGFTPMTEELMKYGKEGAEVLSSILNEVFIPIIDSVYNWGGFISGFAGDAFTAIFPNLNNPESVLQVAGEIKQFFKQNGLRKTHLGDFQLQVKLGISFGDVEWGIVGDDDTNSNINSKSYYFRGSAIDGCADSEHQCKKMDIVIDSIAREFISGRPNSNKPNKIYYKIKNVKPKTTKTTIAKTNNLTNEVLEKFLPNKVLKFRGTGELRNIVSVFISFKGISKHDDINELVTDILTEGNRLGAYVKGLDFGDKGGTILVVFGSPVSYENDVERAINFILSIRNKYRDKIRAGITYGLVFAGLIGSSKRISYDVLGDTVNTSARSMMKAEWGQIWVGRGITNKVKHSFQCDKVGEYEFKGFKEPIPVHNLIKEKRRELIRACF